MKRIVVLVNTLLCCHTVYAVDYTTTQEGPKTFVDGDTVSVTNGSAVKDSTTGGAGIHVANNGVTNSGAIDIEAIGADAIGVDLNNKVANDLGSGSSIYSFGSAGDVTYGINMRGTGTSLTATDLTLQSESDSSTPLAVGLNMEGGTSVILEGATTIEVLNGMGIRVSAATATDPTTFIADTVFISASGDNAVGIHNETNSTLDLGGSSTIETMGDGAIAIENLGGSITAKNLTVVNDNYSDEISKTMDIRGMTDIDGGSITGINSNGVSVSQGGKFFFKNNGSITSSSDSLDTYIYALQSQGVDSVADLDDVALSLQGLGYAMWATDHGNVKANNISISSEGYGVYADLGGTISFTGNTVIEANSTDAAMIVNGEGSQIITGPGGSKMTISGSLFAIDKGLIDLHMQEDSYLSGLVSTGDTATIKLNMIDTQWDMTDDSKVTELTATDTHINFMSSQDNYQTLQIGKLTGNKTTYNMNVDLGSITTAPNAQGERIGQAGVNGDLIKVTEAVNAGSNTLIIANNGAANTQGNEVLQVVQTPNNNIGSFTLPVPVEAGAYEYKLRQSQDSSKNKTGWELYTPSRRTTTAEAATSFLNSNYLLSYIDTQTLLQRMGQLREGTNPQGDFWIRGFGGKLSSFGGQQLSGFDMTYTGTQLGIDKQLTTQLGQAYIGIMGGMTHANPDYRDGDGTTKDYHLGLYGTLMMDNGVYVDAVAKYTYMKNHFSVKDTQGNSVQGKGTSSGYNLSLEAGKRFKLTAAHQSGLYLEPQAQITYGHQSGMSINASNGLKVQLGNYNYTLGRLSTIIGYQIAGANPVNLYLKTGYVREMDGSTSYKLNNQKSTYNARGGWWDNGIGINAQINKSHNIYADINYAKGSRFDQKQLNLGYRYAF